MAQHDYVISDQSGLSFLSDLNNALDAIRTQNSGVVQPAVMYAYMPWADTSTTPATLKVRNAANNGWIVVGSLGDINLGLLSRSGGSMTGALLADYGTASLPGVAFDGDPDTGSFRAGANQYAIATAGVERVEYGATEVVFNDGGNDYDFRIEGNTNPDLFKIDAGLDQVQVANLNGGPLAGFRNLLINGNPTINQRGYVSGAATTGVNQYTLDRWRVVVSGQSISWTDSAGVRTVTAPAGGVEQVIEGLSILGGTYTLNWTGTATATVGGTSVAKGGTVTLTGGTNTTVRFSSGTFSLAQLEPGPVATPFERRSYGQELLLCQRYGESGVWACSGVTHVGNGDTRASFTSFATTKRAVPTITLSTTAISLLVVGPNGAAPNLFGGVGSLQAEVNGFSLAGMTNFANISAAVGGGDYAWGLRNSQSFFASAEL